MCDVCCVLLPWDVLLIGGSRSLVAVVCRLSSLCVVVCCRFSVSLCVGVCRVSHVDVRCRC